MASLKGLRAIPLASKEAKKLLSQPGLNLIHHTSAKDSDELQRLDSISESARISDIDQTKLAESQPHDQISREGGGEMFYYCQSCRVALGDRGEQLVHYRLDWHRYNLKRRLKGQASLSQEEFEKIAGEESILKNYIVWAFWSLYFIKLFCKNLCVILYILLF